LSSREKEKQMSNNSPIDENKGPDILDALHQEHWYVTKLLVLLIIICIASVGSLSLAPHLLPLDSQTQTTPVPKYSDGQCDSHADPDKIQYVSLSSPSTLPNTSTRPSKTSGIMPTPSINKKHSLNITTIDTGAGGLSISSEMGHESLNHLQAKPTQAPPPPTPAPSSTLGQLPGNWYTEGLTADDARYVAACAATFVKTYHTYDATNPQTFESAVYMLSAQAKKNFYLGGPDDTYHTHLRMLPNWQNAAESQQQAEQATVGEPTIQDATTVIPIHTVTVKVGYHLIKQRGGQTTTPRIYYDTVILRNTSPSPTLPKQKIGWQVIAWQDADA
jgi:hypothetical protein